MLILLAFLAVGLLSEAGVCLAKSEGWRPPDRTDRQWARSALTNLALGIALIVAIARHWTL